ncbi:MAG TPA: MFS transporter [Opitutaceae bacterium]|nr:MFS transporter [Opitutaceae bacterium]
MTDTRTSPGASQKGIWTVGTLVYTTSGIIVLFAWLVLGDFAWWMRERSVTPMASWYLTHIEVPNIVFGLMITSLPALIQLVVAPIVSVKSDRYRSRLGRRIPFLIVTTFISMLGMLGLAVTPYIAAWVHDIVGPDSSLHISVLSERVIAVACFTVFWTAFEVAALASKPLFDGLVNDVVPRPLLGRFFGLFRAVGLLDGMVFNYWIMGLVPSHFTLILSVAGIFYGVAFIWVCFKVKEGEYPPPPPLAAATSPFRGMTNSVRLYCKECFSHSYYLSVFTLIMVAGLCFMPVNIFSIPYARNIGLSMDAYGKALALTYFISLCLAFPLGWLADKFHPLRVGMVWLGCYIALSIWAGMFANTSENFLIALVLHGVISGSYYTSAASTLQQHLFPRKNFAQFSSASLIFASVATFCLAPLMGSLIDATGGNYRYTFVISAFLAALALASAAYVYVRFKRLGGQANYVAPEYDVS